MAVTLGLWLPWQLLMASNGEIENLHLWLYVTADILTNLLQKCSLSSLLPITRNFYKLHDLAGCHGNQIVKNRKQT